MVGVRDEFAAANAALRAAFAFQAAATSGAGQAAAAVAAVVAANPASGGRQAAGYFEPSQIAVGKDELEAKQQEELAKLNEVMLAKKGKKAKKAAKEKKGKKAKKAKKASKKSKRDKKKKKKRGSSNSSSSSSSSTSTQGEKKARQQKVKQDSESWDDHPTGQLALPVDITIDVGSSPSLSPEASPDDVAVDVPADDGTAAVSEEAERMDDSFAHSGVPAGEGRQPKRTTEESRDRNSTGGSSGLTEAGAGAAASVATDELTDKVVVAASRVDALRSSVDVAAKGAGGGVRLQSQAQEAAAPRASLDKKKACEPKAGRDGNRERDRRGAQERSSAAAAAPTAAAAAAAPAAAPSPADEDEDEADGIERRLAESALYREDVLQNGHSQVWGSWFDIENKRWGYLCCRSYARDSACEAAPDTQRRRPRHDDSTEMAATDTAGAVTQQCRKAVPAGFRPCDSFPDVMGFITHWIETVLHEWEAALKAENPLVIAEPRFGSRGLAEAQRAVAPLVQLLQAGSPRFFAGEAAHVWSVGNDKWMKDGKVLEVLDVDTTITGSRTSVDGSTLPAGSVLVSFSGGEAKKWIPADQVTKKLRKARRVELSSGMVEKLQQIAGLSVDREYHAANQTYIELTMGHNKWHGEMSRFGFTGCNKAPRGGNKVSQDMSSFLDTKEAKDYMICLKRLVAFLQLLRPNADVSKHFT